jgi:hypothetical protein
MLCGTILLSSLCQGLAQGLSVVRTGTGSPLVTESQTIFVPASDNGAWIRLAVGFATDETVAPNTVFDSATLTLQYGSATPTAIIFTADCNGWFWSPSGGTIAIAPNSIDRSSILFPDLTPTYAQQTAWLLTVPVPFSMTGQTLNLHLDLFDNQNSFGSLAWMGPATVIPEPSIFALSAIVAAFVLRRRFLGN